MSLLFKANVVKIQVLSVSRLMSTSNIHADDVIRRKMLEKIIRVDHAGELGASYIYRGKSKSLAKLKKKANINHCILIGQMAILKNNQRAAPLIQEMWDQEKEHLHKFEQLLITYNVKPTIFQPLWKAAGFTLGAGCALLGEAGAMACTVAVEDLVTKHYDDQVKEMLEHDPSLDKDLIATIKQFRDDEQNHLDMGLAHGAENAPLYNLLTKVINYGCRNAIWISEKI